eukprot:TRINITY_DN12034_c0_g1_i1.p1 TRINITY_DN12034_c0_g1~~TRINITY_DN12034_c0_g1_i1.p1  ORF type:complete len:694 (+),score=129.88 TRINITY_DN12034_c0_g1_i1:41-2083(+)
MDGIPDGKPLGPRKQRVVSLRGQARADFPLPHHHSRKRVRKCGGVAWRMPTPRDRGSGLPALDEDRRLFCGGKVQTCGARSGTSADSVQLQNFNFRGLQDHQQRLEAQLALITQKLDALTSRFDSSLVAPQTRTNQSEKLNQKEAGTQVTPELAEKDGRFVSVAHHRPKPSVFANATGAVPGAALSRSGLNRSAKHLEDLRLQFARLDSQGRGQVSAKDFWEMLDRQGLCIPIEEIVDEMGMVLTEYYKGHRHESKKLSGALSLSFDEFHSLMDEPKHDCLLLKQGLLQESYLEARGHLVGLSSGALTVKDLFAEAVPGLVIALNALVIGISSDLAPDHFAWTIIEILFTIFFTGELVAKFKMFGCRVALCGPERYWNWFDLFCVLTGTMDLVITWIVTYVMGLETTSGGDQADAGFLTLLKMVRLARLTRIVRLLRFEIVSPLRAMILGVVSGLRVLLWALVLLILVVYLMGLVMRKLASKHDEFDSVMKAMFTLFRCVTDGCSAYDGTPLHERLREDYGAIFVLLYGVLFLFITIGLFNLIMAIFVDDVLSNQAMKRRRELEASTSDVENEVRSAIVKLAVELRNCRAGSSHLCIERDEFQEWIQKPEVASMLEDAGIDMSTKRELFDTLDGDLSGSLQVDELVRGLMMLRGVVSKSDIVGVRLLVRGFVNNFAAQQQ